jgi:glutathione synthase/RimK-type ligase-like ATP-grasp enzyme
MKRVALVTSVEARDLDEDLPPLAKALEAEGLTSQVVAWDDPRVEWSTYPLVVVRSTWDYVPRRDQFVQWSRRVASCTRIANSAAILEWNTDKRYLGELASAGIPAVPTSWIAPGEAIALPPDGALVIKPSISAGAKDTARYAAQEARAARAHIERLHAAGRTAMVQPYLHHLDETGETALVYFAGVYSHSVRKGALWRSAPQLVRGLYAQETIHACEPTATERALADRVLGAVREPLLYARVDLAPGSDGRPLLLELELTEPSLFLAHSEGAAGRLALAIPKLVDAPHHQAR